MAEQPQEKPQQASQPIQTETKTVQAYAPQQPVVIKQGGGKALGIGALVLSLIALGASGLLFVQGQNSFNNLDTKVSNKIDQAKIGEVDAVAAMKKNQADQLELQNKLQLLQKDNQRLNSQLTQVDQAYQQLVKSRHQWLVDEIEFSLNVATQQLLLTGNKEATIKSLKSIESRLNQFDKPELVPLKQAISTDLIALSQGASNVNITSTAVMISSLEGRVDGLKTLLEGVLTKPDAPDAASNPNVSWWQNVWNGIKDSFKGLVEVRKLDNKDAMLISPEQSEYLKENIRLHLVSARIALMQQQSELYKSELQAVDTAMRRYYDTNDKLTKDWLADLAQVQQVQLGGNPADGLKNSLAAVQQFQQQNQEQTSVFSVPQAPLNASAPQAATPPAAASAPHAEPAKPKAASEAEVKGGRA